MRKLQFLLLAFCLSIATNSYGLDFKEDFTVVFIDSDTESKLGSFPFDRAILAKGIETLSEAGAKGVIFKFFIDQAKDKKSDARLASSFKKIPVLLQARIANVEPAKDESAKNGPAKDEPGPNHFPKRFTLKLDASTDIVGESGWIPHPQFAEVASDICFADFSGLPLSMLGKYQNQIIKSLLLCSIEMALGKKAMISPQYKIDFEGLTLPLDVNNHVMSPLKIEPVDDYISFHTLLDGTADRSKLRGKVVILAYTGNSIPMIETSLGSIGSHHYFIILLKALYETRN